jgi:hypothetical protein
MSLTDPSGSAVTGLTVSSGGNAAFLSNGVLNFSANFDIFYSNQTDCLTWNAASCTPSNNQTTVGEVLTATFADQSVLDIYLYNWSDWNMAPTIGFDVVSGPVTSVAEPASFAVFIVALIGLFAMARSRAGSVRRAFA